MNKQIYPWCFHFWPFKPKHREYQDYEELWTVYLIFKSICVYLGNSTLIYKRTENYMFKPQKKTHFIPTWDSIQTLKHSHTHTINSIRHRGKIDWEVKKFKIPFFHSNEMFLYHTNKYYLSLALCCCFPPVIIETFEIRNKHTEGNNFSKSKRKKKKFLSENLFLMRFQEFFLCFVFWRAGTVIYIIWNFLINNIKVV